MSQTAWFLAAIGVAIGIWLIVRAWRQFRHPETLNLPGISIVLRP